MTDAKRLSVNSSVGRQEIDHQGVPVAVARMDANRAYAGIGELLQKWITGADIDAWHQVKTKIDYLYHQLDRMLTTLDQETGFGAEILQRLEKGQKLLFKPNTVNPMVISALHHGPDVGSTCVTEWSFVAALMRWFHDKRNISYYQMCLGEAATAMSAAAAHYSMCYSPDRIVTTEAVLEGKSGNFYGGWGFYFARCYLAESLPAGAKDDPLMGFEESEKGIYIPPGEVNDKLLVYDLNRIYDDPSKGREIEVPQGVNYRTITLHKTIVGGDPLDPSDRRSYPGCILINVPKLKVHCFTLMTNAVKNLGIGLYPMQSTKTGDFRWQYAVPHKQIPGMKGGIPHQIHVPELDPATHLPRKDEQDRYITRKTGGINAAMADIVKAVAHQGVFMFHVVDAIEVTNMDHMGSDAALKVSEGLAVAGLDPVAVDLLCSRYMFCNVPLGEALNVDMDDGMGGRFPQAVPVPVREGRSIITRPGYDCPLCRDRCLKTAEDRGVGQRHYHVIGHDALTDSRIVSLQGHLGLLKNGAFEDLITRTVYFDVYKMPWDLQKTAFGYMAAMDDLTGSALKETFLKALDEDGDGQVTYDDFGRKGFSTAMLWLTGESVAVMGRDALGYLKGRFINALMARFSEPAMNTQGHDIFHELMVGLNIMAAWQMSQLDMEMEDPFQPGLIWGKGKWPSYQLAKFCQTGISIYGQGFPFGIAAPSLYSDAFFYADITQNNGRYAEAARSQESPDLVNQYLSRVLSGEEKPLEFTLFVPEGYGDLSGNKVPNVEVTGNPHKYYTVTFDGGKETWPDALI